MSTYQVNELVEGHPNVDGHCLRLVVYRPDVHVIVGEQVLYEVMLCLTSATCTKGEQDL